MGSRFTFLRTDSHCSVENRSRGVQKGCGSVHSKHSGGGREAEKRQMLDFRLTQLGGGGQPLPQGGSQKGREQQLGLELLARIF